jgi:hypothetical protein
MKLTVDDLRKQASATAYRRHFGVAAPPSEGRPLGKSELLRRGLSSQFDRTTEGEGSSLFKRKRVSVDRVPVGDGHSVTVDHDIDDAGLVVAGVAVDLNELPIDLRSRFEIAVDHFQAADEDLGAQNRARGDIARVVREVLARDRHINNTVKERIRSRGRVRA